MGKALTTPYVTYSFTSNSEQAFEELESKKASLDEKVYKAARRSLVSIAGYQSVSELGIFTQPSAFQIRFMVVSTTPFEDNTENNDYLIQQCDSIAQAHMSDTLVVKAVVNVCKTNVADEKTDIIKTYEFPAN